MRKILIILISFLSELTQASTVEFLTQLETQINQVFHQQISDAGFKEYRYKIDDLHQDYVGGVKVDSQNIIMIVGSSQLSKYKESSLRFITCHELGHLIAGAPYKNNSHTTKEFKLSFESQSDYWAGQTCLPLLSPNPLQDALDFFTDLSESLKDIVGDNPFYAAPVQGLDELGIYHSEYASFQCRFNTVEAGFQQKEKPTCWDEASVNQAVK